MQVMLTSCIKIYKLFTNIMNNNKSKFSRELFVPIINYVKNPRVPGDPWSNDSTGFSYRSDRWHLLWVPDRNFVELYDIIKQNGCVCIKFFQWLLPIIETYYCKDNKPVWFKLIWRCVDVFRRLICVLPFRCKLIITKLIAFFVYFPLARFSYFLELNIQ